MKHEMDERQKEIRLKAIAFGGVFVALCLIIAMAVDIVKTGDIGWEFWALIGASFVIVISRRVMGDVEAPTDFFDRPLPTGNSKEDRRYRKMDYARKSALFAGVFAVMDVVLIGFGAEELTDLELTEMLFPSLGHAATTVVTAVIVFVTMFVISYVCEYLIGEYYKIKTYNRLMAELDAEEDGE